MRDVTVVLATEEGPRVVAGTTITVSAAGLEVVGRDWAPVVSIPWADVSSLDVREDEKARGGRRVLDVRLVDRHHRLLVAARDVATFLSWRAHLGATTPGGAEPSLPMAAEGANDIEICAAPSSETPRALTATAPRRGNAARARHAKRSRLPRRRPRPRRSRRRGDNAKAATLGLATVLGLAAALGREPPPPSPSASASGATTRRRTPRVAAGVGAPPATAGHARGRHVPAAARARHGATRGRGAPRGAPRPASSASDAPGQPGSLVLTSADIYARRRPGRVGTSARHAAPSRLRISAVAACVLAVVLAVTGTIVGVLNTGGAVAATSKGTADQEGPGVSIMKRMAQDYAGSAAANSLPAAAAPPAPAPPSLANAPALNAHEIFGFAGYWALPQSATFDLTGVTTLAYFSIGVNRNATLAESGPGWVGYQSQALADLVTRAHSAGDRVVLSVTCFDQAALNQVAADPTSGSRLGSELVQLVAAKNLDGVNVDFEGNGGGDQKGLDRLMAALSATVHQADAHWQVTMDTYGSSAADPSGFYDIAGLAPSVDAFFVMAYDMGNRTVPSPTAPLSGPGFTDLARRAGVQRGRLTVEGDPRRPVLRL